jgi:surface polysaccharide O-acyltransferase-like enzyme
MEYKDRIVYADLLRTSALAAVILLHTAALKWYSTPVNTFAWQVMNIYTGLTRWPVPIFVMVCGIFHLRPLSSSLKQPLHCKEEYRILLQKRLLRLIYAIAFWTIVYNGYDLLTRYFVLHEPIGLMEVLLVPLKIPLGPGWRHLWILYMIIGLYLLTPLVRIFIAHAEKPHLKCFLILSGVIGSGFPFLNFIMEKIHGASAYKIYLPVPELSGYLGYYVAGYYFANNAIRKRTRTAFYCTAIIAVVLTILGTAYLSLKNNRPEEFLYGPLLPATMLVSFSIFLIFKQVFGSRRFSQKQIQSFCSISGCTLGVYIFHDLVLRVFQLWGLSPVSFNPLFSIPLISTAVLVISLIAVSLIKKIPILEKYIV